MRLIRELREEIARLRALLGGDMVSVHSFFCCLCSYLVLVFVFCLFESHGVDLACLVTRCGASPNLHACSQGYGAEGQHWG